MRPVDATAVIEFLLANGRDDDHVRANLMQPTVVVVADGEGVHTLGVTSPSKRWGCKTTDRVVTQPDAPTILWHFTYLGT